MVISNEGAGVETRKVLQQTRLDWQRHLTAKGPHPDGSLHALAWARLLQHTAASAAVETGGSVPVGDGGKVEPAAMGKLSVHQVCTSLLSNTNQVVHFAPIGNRPIRVGPPEAPWIWILRFSRRVLPGHVPHFQENLVAMHSELFKGVGITVRADIPPEPRALRDLRDQVRRAREDDADMLAREG